MKKNILLIVLIAVFMVLIVQSIINRAYRFKSPVNGAVTSGFGTRQHPITGNQSFHNGIDIAAPIGTPVYSPFSGVVSTRYYNSAGGNQLIIKHDNGYTTGYAHLSEYTVEENQRVKKGDKIAAVGATGAVTGPHLHFTVKNSSGEFIDPKTLIS